MVKVISEKYEKLRASGMNERLRRHWAACEALSLGRGGISAVSEATGISRTTIRRGMRELEEDYPELLERLKQQGRVRKPGGGRRPLTEKDPQLLEDLRRLVEPATCGDPTRPLLWSSKSTRNLAEALRRQGHSVSHATVRTLLKRMGYSLQGNRKSRDGGECPDRDEQFGYINEQVEDFQRRGQPVISVDTKKRELVGRYKNGGQEWRPKGEPEEVRMHDFRDPELGIAIPYGVYDVKENAGWVNVGITADTAEFAAESIRRWWQRMGRAVYPEATELLITADAGGSNGYRNRLWKRCLQELADQTGLKITVCHFPPGASKWNKIEHRLFCHITQNWRGRPLESLEVIVNLIANTTTRTGLKVQAEVDRKAYKKRIKVTDNELKSLNLQRHEFHGEWNYTVEPRKQA